MPASDPAGGAPVAGQGAAPALDGMPPSVQQAGDPPAGGGDGEPVPGAAAEYDHAMEEIALDADLVVAAGETLRVGPGTSFVAASGVKVQVDGILIVTGTAAAPVRFAGAGTPRSWHGIVIAGGGSATLTHVHVSGATYGIHALPGSEFAVDHADLGTSFKAAVVQSDGSFDHTRFHASGDFTFSAVNEVSIDDVNGTLTILDASPRVSNSSFDGSALLVDMIRVGGDASPVFDHIHVVGAHCGIHAFGGINSAPIVTNSVFEQLAFGLMAYTTAPRVEDSVFLMNANDIGFCFGATADNRPSLRNNFYSSGSPVVDPSCFQIGTTDDSPATAAHPGAGPVGL
jgi:hypothetical protein